MGRSKRPRKSVDELNEAAVQQRRQVLAKARQEELDKDRPFWEVWWDMCFCSEGFKRRAFVEGLVGGYLCDSKESPRYAALEREGKKVVLKSELPEDAVFLRLDEPEKKPRKVYRLQYRVNADGQIIDAFYG